MGSKNNEILGVADSYAEGMNNGSLGYADNSEQGINNGEFWYADNIQHRIMRKRLDAGNYSLAVSNGRFEHKLLLIIL